MGAQRALVVLSGSLTSVFCIYTHLLVKRHIRQRPCAKCGHMWHVCPCSLSSGGRSEGTPCLTAFGTLSQLVTQGTMSREGWPPWSSSRGLLAQERSINSQFWLDYVLLIFSPRLLTAFPFKRPCEQTCHRAEKNP